MIHPLGYRLQDCLCIRGRWDENLPASWICKRIIMGNDYIRENSVAQWFHQNEPISLERTEIAIPQTTIVEMWSLW